MKKKNPFKENKNEIKYQVINSVLAGALPLLGALANGGNLTIAGLITAGVIGVSAGLLQFKDYWTSQSKEYSRKGQLFNFI